MSPGVETALALLGGLHEADRRWILEHLPAAAKARLVAGAGSALDAWDASSVIDVLNSEPAWLIHAVLSAGDWRWKAEVMDRLPASVRKQVGALARDGVSLARPAVEFLLRSLSERLERHRPATKFDSLVMDLTR